MTYSGDLTGGSHYEKMYEGERKRVPIAERRIDLDELSRIAEEWEKVIVKTDHPERLLQIMCKEARDLIKILNKLPEFNLENNQFSRAGHFYRYKKWSIILFARFTYLMAKEVFEYSSSDDFHFSLRGKIIKMDEKSLIHILQKHYGEGAKYFKSGKSHFSREFKPRELHNRFKNIIERGFVAWLLIIQK